MRWSIRYRLFVPLGLLLLGVGGITTWSAMAAARHAEERIAKQVRSVTHTLASARFSLTLPILDQMKGLSGAEYIYIGPDEDRLSTFPSPDLQLSPEILQQPADEVSDELGVPIELNNERYRCRKQPLQSGGTLLIFFPEVSLNEAIRDAVWPSVILGLFAGLGSVALMLVITQSLVARIRSLERRTRLIAAGDFSPMPLPRQHDELRDLTQSVNEMADRLAQLQATVQKTERFRLIGQLSSGLAHQLRNSVTGARLAVQVHNGECPAQDKEALQVVLRQLALMEANLRRFMDLGRTESFKREHCSLTKILNETIELIAPQARHTGIELNWQPPTTDLLLDGDSVQLGHLFLNVIGNAIEAAGPNGKVEVRTTIVDEKVVIEVLDTGKGPAPEIAARLFEPFVTGKPEGIGLGLAVAKQAAEAHGGSIDWRREGDRTCFRIVLANP
jgi:signal transduction histidine kinase